jgi:hypothetical protein
MSMNKQQMKDLTALLIEEESMANISLGYVDEGKFCNHDVIVIHDCSAATTKRLVQKGYSLFIQKDGVHVDVIGELNEG